MIIFVLGYITGRLKYSLINLESIDSIKKKHKNYGLNVNKKDFYYWALIVSIICIIWMSSDLYTNEKFSYYISFAGTITSILLGFLAIFYSFVQSIDGNNSIKVLQDISSDLAKYSEEINEKITEFSGLSDTLKESNKNLDEQLQNATQKLDQMYDNLNTMSKKIESITEYNGEKEWTDKNVEVTR